jgi:transcription elongation factor GreA
MSLQEKLTHKIDEELRQFDYELRVELPRAFAVAKGHGDLSENADYDAARQRRSFVEARIQQLRKMRQELSLVNLNAIPRDQIGLGSKVVVRDLETDTQRSFELVLGAEADPNNGKISITSPIGRGLMGLTEGDEAEIRTPGGMRNYEILSYRTIYQQEGE